MRNDAKQQSHRIKYSHKKGIYSITLGLNRLQGLFFTGLQDFFFVCGGGMTNFIYICGMSITVESSLFVVGPSCWIL